MNDQDEEVLFTLLGELQKEIHETAKSKGWWPLEGNVVAEGPDANFAKNIALIHSELSEALEYWRHGNKSSDHIPEYSGAEEEFADVLIRMLDVCGWYKFNLSGALLAKMAFNKTRAFKHGGKKF